MFPVRLDVGRQTNTREIVSSPEVIRAVYHMDGLIEFPDLVDQHSDSGESDAGDDAGSSDDEDSGDDDDGLGGRVKGLTLLPYLCTSPHKQKTARTFGVEYVVEGSAHPVQFRGRRQHSNGKGLSKSDLKC